jgi:hypothetical protein
MPTIAEAINLMRGIPIRGLLAVVTIWFVSMGVAAVVVRPDTVVGFGLPGTMIPAVAESDGYLLDAGRFHVSAKTGPSTVRSLYAAGAWFVWPAVGKGCGRPRMYSRLEI